MSFLGGREAPNILRYGKLLAPQFEDEIAGLQKWPFLAGFDQFWCRTQLTDPSHK